MIGFISVLFLSETYLSDLSEMWGEERRLLAEDGVATAE